MSNKFTVYSSMEIARDARDRDGKMIPVLFMGNPGQAKTSYVRQWGRENGYEVVTLTSSQKTAEDIGGYMVNTGSELEHFAPAWYNQIMKLHAEGKKTVLFFDEIVQAKPDTQGAVLTIIFDRKGDFGALPEDCIIAAASNYKDNLPDYCNMQGPLVNRFLVVNVEVEDADEFCDEFFTEDYADDIKITVQNNEYDEDTRHEFFGRMSKMFKDLLKNKDLELDLKNKKLDNIFEANGNIVMNFLSGRTGSWLEYLVWDAMKLGLTSDEVIRNLVIGTVGAGTNSFSSMQNHAMYLNEVVGRVISIVKETTRKATKDIKKVLQGNNVSDVVNSFIVYSNSGTEINKDEVAALAKTIKNAYPIDEASFEKKIVSLASKKDTQFSNDITSISVLLNALTEAKNNDPTIKPHYQVIETVFARYRYYSESKVGQTKRAKHTLLVATDKGKQFALFTEIENMVVIFEKAHAASIDTSKIKAVLEADGSWSTK